MIRWLALILVLVVLAAPSFAPYDPMTTAPADQLQPPSTAHPLGTDLLGRDVLSRALYGGQRTLLIALAASLIALVPGVLIGLLSVFVSPRVDTVIQAVMNAVLAFPGVILALVILTLIGAGTLSLAVATGVMQIAPTARIVRIAALQARQELYIKAAASLGATRLRLLLHHILPNIMTTTAAYAVTVFSLSVLNYAALSFLGLGGDPGVPDWGVMLADGRTAFRAAPWIGLAPGLAITLTVLLLSTVARSITGRK